MPLVSHLVHPGAHSEKKINYSVAFWLNENLNKLIIFKEIKAMNSYY